MMVFSIERVHRLETLMVTDNLTILHGVWVLLVWKIHQMKVGLDVIALMQKNPQFKFTQLISFLILKN